MATTWYAIDIPADDEQALLTEGFSFSWTPPYTNAGQHIRLVFRECIGQHKLTYPNGDPVGPEALDPDGGPIVITWNPTCGCFTTPIPVPPPPVCNLGTPGELTEVNADPAWQTNDPEFHRFTLTAASDGTLELLWEWGTDGVSYPNSTVLDTDAWHNESPAASDPSNYEVRIGSEDGTPVTSGPTELVWTSLASDVVWTWIWEYTVTPDVSVIAIPLEFRDPDNLTCTTSCDLTFEISVF